MAVARVLLVEPNDHLRRVFRRRFVREGFDLVEAVDAEAALGEARSGLPDVIVLEGSVRDAGGLDLSLRLARDPDLRWVPLIVLEGRGRWDVTPEPRVEDEVVCAKACRSPKRHSRVPGAVRGRRRCVVAPSA